MFPTIGVPGKLLASHQSVYGPAAHPYPWPRLLTVRLSPSGCEWLLRLDQNAKQSFAEARPQAELGNEKQRTQGEAPGDRPSRPPHFRLRFPLPYRRNPCPPPPTKSRS